MSWSIFRLELRRSPTFVLIPALFVLGVFVAWRGTYEGLDLGNRATAATLGVNQLLGPMAAGLAAFGSRRMRANRLAPMLNLGVREREAPLHQLLGLLLPVLLAYAAVAVTMAVRTAVGNPFGQFGWDGAAAGLLGLCVHMAFGFIVGSLLPFRLTPPLVVGAAFVLEGLLLDGYGQPWYLFAPVLVQTVTAFWTWAPGMLWAQTLWYLGVFVALLLACTCLINVRRAPRILPVGAVLTVVLLGIPLSTFDGRALAPGDVAFAYVCSGAQPTICIHPAYRSGLRQLEASFGSLASKLDGSPGAITRLQQIPRDGTKPEPGSNGFSMDDVTPSSSAAAVAEYVQNLVTWDRCPNDYATSQFSVLVGSWLAGTPLTLSELGLSTQFGIAPADVAAADQFLRESEDQKTAWLVAHYNDFTGCTLTAATLGQG